MSDNIPLSQQVNAFMQKANGAAPPGNPFAQIAPAVTPAPTASANPFAAAVAQAAPTSQPSANPFAAAVAQPPPAQAAPNPFAGEAAAAIKAVAQAAPVNAFAGFAQAAPAGYTGPIPVAEAQRAAWITHCDAGGFDYASGELKNKPAALPVTQAAPVDESESFRKLAQRIYDEGRAPDATHHPEVVRIYGAILQVKGPPASGLGRRDDVADAPKAKRTRRTKAEMAAAGEVDTDESPQIIITQKAVQEMITFLQSLMTGAA